MTVTDTRPRSTDQPSGRFILEDGIEWYRIDDYDLLDPFLVSVVTPTDQWMFVSSSGALTAGRRSAEHALFPYETDDRLHRAGGRTGPTTLIRVGPEVWEPFHPDTPLDTVRRSIAKTVEGDRLRFEEHHPGLGLTFRYTWAAADRFGFIRTCQLTRADDLDGITVEVHDGLCDVLPAGVELAAQQTTSTLVDAYRRAEYHAHGIAVFTLEALVSDRPEPAESLSSTLVWSRGLPQPTVSLSESQIRRFRSGRNVEPEHRVTGRKAGFFVTAAVEVAAGNPIRWSIVADVECNHARLAELGAWLATAESPQDELAEAIDLSRRSLIDVVEDADAIQVTADRRTTAHHFANVLFNVMRGGVFLNEQRVEIEDVERFMHARNSMVAPRFAEAVSGLDPVVELADLKAAVRADADLSRLVSEYLPLSFSRRHGDPSRPWNTFEISVRGAGGGFATGYEGNWRDIFQNWDALVHSFPEYIESVIAKFLSASTVDGFNPYRITDDGIDWEMPEEGNWSNLGYWGDHQIAYLYRLLDASDRFYPGALEQDLDRVWLSYADVPYRIAPYDEIVADPKSTIEFDHERQAKIEQRVAKLGADGRLVPSGDGTGVHLASLGEKLLVPALSKLSNLVAGGGIWMNTQRPEWNDANNALVGNGVSVVTLFYLREYLELIDRLLGAGRVDSVPIGASVAKWLEDLHGVYDAHRHVVASDAIDPADRRSLLDGIGSAFSEYRDVAYEAGPGGPVVVPVASLREFIAAVRPFLDQAVRVSRRADGLAEAYCLLHLDAGVAHLESLYEMLEGQVAFLSEADVGTAEVVALVDRMFAGGLYRPDQHTFLLYPDRSLPPFWEKNIVPESALGPAATSLLEAGAGILYRDVDGHVRFDGSFGSARELRRSLDEHGVEPGAQEELLDLYESVFRHAAFTGRSGTMYRYEGLGSVYWHMVSKLLFAIQEHVARATRNGEPAEDVAALADRYRRVRAGLGYMKDVAEQGTFPTDPHSHTPAHTGAQQPGMTGQVKEGVLLRWGELGVRVEQGRVSFRPTVLLRKEFLTEPEQWVRDGGSETLEAGTLGFTYCGVPVVYHLEGGDPWTRVTWADGRETSASNSFDEETSRALFQRRGLIQHIDVGIPEAWLVDGD